MAKQLRQNYRKMLIQSTLMVRRHNPPVPIIFTRLTIYLALDMAQRVRILRLLASSELGRLFMRTADEDDDDEPHFFRRRNRRARPDPNRFPKVPSDRGTQLMNFGNFGASEVRSFKNITQKKKLARRILDRELGIDIGARKILNQQLMAQVVQSFSPRHCIADSFRA